MAERCFHGSHGEVEDMAQFFRWATKAADSGDQSGLSWLGIAYYLGAGVQKSFVEAIPFLEKAACLQCPDSMFLLGVIFEEGGSGVDKNLTQSYSWYRQSAQAGCAVACREVGLMLYKGVGISKDDDEAREWFEGGASQHDPPSKYYLGLMLVTGDGGDKDFSRGMCLLHEAACDGVCNAIKYLTKIEILLSGAELYSEIIEER
jgi:hypothetical protein